MYPVYRACIPCSDSPCFCGRAQVDFCSLESQLEASEQASEGLRKELKGAIAQSAALAKGAQVQTKRAAATDEQLVKLTKVVASLEKDMLMLRKDAHSGDV